MAVRLMRGMHGCMHGCGACVGVAVACMRIVGCACLTTAVPRHLRSPMQVSLFANTRRQQTSRLTNYRTKISMPDGDTQA